jgi:hypothetical protein
MNRDAHLKISEGIDKAASPCHNEKKKNMIPCRRIIPTSKHLEFRPTMFAFLATGGNHPFSIILITQERGKYAIQRKKRTHGRFKR